MPPIWNALICSFSSVFLVISIFLLLHFPFCITAGTGVLSCNPLAHAARGLGVSASCSTANNCCRGHRSRCDTATTATCSCTTKTAAAVHDAVEHAATVTCRAHYCFRYTCYALVVRASCLVVRTTHLVARALSSFPQTLSQQLTQLSLTQPLWPAPQSPLRAASQQLSRMLFPGGSPTLGSPVRGSLPVGQVQQVLFGPLPVQQQQEMQQQQVQAAAQQVGSPEQSRAAGNTAAAPAAAAGADGPATAATTTTTGTGTGTRYVCHCAHFQHCCARFIRCSTRDLIVCARYGPTLCPIVT